MAKPASSKRRTQLPTLTESLELQLRGAQNVIAERDVQLRDKAAECETLQEANSGLGISLANVRQNIENLRSTIQAMEKASQRALSRRIHVDNYVNTLNERIAYLKRPWWSRSASYANQLRIASDMALDRINRFDMDKDPSAADAPGAIMGLDTRAGAKSAADQYAANGQAGYYSSAVTPAHVARPDIFKDPDANPRTQAQIDANGPYQTAARAEKFKRDGYV